MSTKKFNIAVLIDGDNAQASLIKEIIEEVSIYGKATIRRVYGDWTTPQMNSWKDMINKFSINPIQKFSYTSGKNSTDTSLIIDAMDILHAGNIEGFCIVSSDSDYTGLAKRIREEGLFVMGIGRRITPIAFVNSCEIFTFTENLRSQNTQEKDHTAKTESRVKKATAKKKTVKKSSSSKDTADTTANKNDALSDVKTEPSDQTPVLDMSIIDRAFDISANENDEAYISHVGLNLRKIDPSFDPRTYGYKTLTKLFETLVKYEIVNNEVNGLKHPILRLRG